MSAVSVVPPTHATQRPIAGSSSVNSKTSTGPLVVAIRTLSFFASIGMIHYAAATNSSRSERRTHSKPGTSTAFAEQMSTSLTSRADLDQLDHFHNLW